MYAFRTREPSTPVRGDLSLKPEPRQLTAVLRSSNFAHVLGRIASAAAMIALAGPAGVHAEGAQQHPRGTDGVLATQNTANRGAIATRVSPRRLAPRGPRVVLGEYHDTYAYSPDRASVAFGISAPGKTDRIGVRIVNGNPLAQATDIETGIYAAGLAWPEPNRLIALLGVGGVVCTTPNCPAEEPPFYATVALLDPMSAEVLDQQRLLLGADEFPCRSVNVQGHGLVVQGGRRVYVVDDHLEASAIKLPRVYGRCAPVANSPDGARLFAVAKDSRKIAEIDVGSAKVTEHRLPRGLGGRVRVTGVDARRVVFVDQRDGASSWLTWNGKLAASSTGRPPGRRWQAGWS